MQTHVSPSSDGEVRYLTFTCDEPDKPRTLDMTVLAELDAQLAEIEAEGECVRAVVLRSDSERYFVVGANIRALEALDVEAVVPWIQKGHQVFDRLEALPVPTIARIGGYALGGGLELAMACDLIYAAAGARFGQPEAGLGFVAGWGGTWRLPRRVGLARAKELLFSGRIIDAKAAYRIGLVDYVGEAEALSAALSGLLTEICRGSPVAIAQMKRLVNQSLDLTLEQSCDAEAQASVMCMSSGDAPKRVRAFLESRRK